MKGRKRVDMTPRASMAIVIICCVVVIVQGRKRLWRVRGLTAIGDVEHDEYDEHTRYYEIIGPEDEERESRRGKSKIGGEVGAKKW